MPQVVLTSQNLSPLLLVVILATRPISSSEVLSGSLEGLALPLRMGLSERA